MVSTSNGNGSDELRAMTPEIALDAMIQFGSETQRILREIVMHDNRKGPHPYGVYQEIPQSPVLVDPRHRKQQQFRLVGVIVDVQALGVVQQAAAVLSDQRELERRKRAEDERDRETPEDSE